MQKIIVYVPDHETSELTMNVNGVRYRINLFTKNTSWIQREDTKKFWDRNEYTHGQFLSDLIEYSDGSRKPSPKSEPLSSILASIMEEAAIEAGILRHPDEN